MYVPIAVRARIKFIDSPDLEDSLDVSKASVYVLPDFIGYYDSRRRYLHLSAGTFDKGQIRALNSPLGNRLKALYLLALFPFLLMLGAALIAGYRIGQHHPIEHKQMIDAKGATQ